MNTSAIGSLASGTSPAGTEVQLTVLKKAINLEANGALQLLQSLPAPQPANNPPHMGKSVDTFA